jgi:hypothetical protein
MDVNNVDEEKDKNCNNKPKTMKEDELLPQLTVHSLKNLQPKPLCRSFQLMKYSRIRRLRKP